MIRFTRLHVIPCVLAIMGLGLIALAALRAQQSPSSPAPPPKPPATAVLTPAEQVAQLSAQLKDLTKDREVLQDRMKAISDQASQIQSLLTTVLNVAGLLVLIQGALAFVAAQNYVKQAEDAVRQVNAAASTAKDSFPILADAASVFQDVVGELGKLGNTLHGDFENIYMKLDTLQRQKILATEHFAALQSVSTANRGDDLNRSFRLLGRFYLGKFVTERSQNDFERAHYYLDVASQKSNRSYSSVNDLGWLFSLGKQPDRARALFEESFRAKPDQQRALYNLGTIACERGSQAKLEVSRDYLERAAKLHNWEDGPNEIMASHICYNIACCYDGLASFETETAAKIRILDKALANLEGAAGVCAQPMSLLDADLNTGDLANLGTSQEHLERLKRIRKAYEAKWATGARAD